MDVQALHRAYSASRPHLSHLTRSEFSALIALVGALSPAWGEFVLEIGADLGALGRRTADADRYWLMLAHLSCALSCFRAGECVGSGE
jgi:hypothetical protein